MFSWLLLAATASAQVVPSTDCTSNSFTFPSWLIDDLHYTNDTTSLRITNRAIDDTSFLTCSGGSCASDTWSNDTLQVSVRLDGSSASFNVNQTWTCNDRSALRFTAVGNASRALSDSLPLLVRGSLLSPVVITPQYAWGPTGHSNPGCASRGAWTVSTPFYENQTGDGITAMASQDFTVLLTNTVTGYQAGCMSGAGFGDGLTPTPATGMLNLVCAGAEFQSSGGGQYSISTAATFDPSNFQFSVNQTWFCDDVSPAEPVQITALASEALALDCTSTTNGKTSCIGRDTTLTSPRVSSVALRPYSIEDPVPGPDGCTLLSLFRPKWTFSAFEVDTEGNSSSVSFNIILATGSPGFQFPISIYQGEAQGGWSKCIIGSAGDTGPVLWPTSCSFSYDAATKELSLRAEWSCDDYDPDHPIIFNGVTTTTVDNPLACQASQGGTQCVTEDGAYQWTANITDVTWHQ